MAITKVTGHVIEPTTNIQAGIITATRFDGPIGTGLTDGNFSGIVTTSELKANGIGVTSLSVTGVSTLTGNVSIGSSLLFADNKKAIFGDNAGGYLEVYNSGADSIIKSNTDDLWIYGHDNIFLAGATSNHKYLRTVDSGTVALYFNNTQRFETTNTGTLTTGICSATDFSGAAGGAADFPNGLTGTTATFSGNVSIGGTLTYEDVTNVDAVGLITARDGIFVPDTKEIKIGNTAASPDLKLHHTGNHSYIEDVGTGSLYIDSNQLYLRNNDTSNVLLYTTSGGEVRINHNGNTKLTTTSTGVSITGIPVATQNTGNVGLELHATGSGRGSQTKYHNDHGEAYIGQAGDTTGELLIHNTTASNINIATGNANRIKIAGNSAATSIGGAMTFNAMLTVQGDISGGLLALKATENTNRLMISGTDTNGVEVNLYDGAGGQKGILGVSGSEFFIKAPNNSAPLTFYTHNGSSIGEKLRITSAGNLKVPDNAKIELGGVQTGSGDFQIYHDTVHTYLKNRHTTGMTLLQVNDDEYGIKIQPNGFCQLYHSNVLKLSTTSTGIEVSGITTATAYDLSAIDTSLSVNTTNIVDICVYDTSKDTDGGEWRKKCGNTSWYNETFSATRGSKKEFPAVAVIVLLGGTVSSYGSDNNSQKILIYDGDDPTLPLWMAFHGHVDEDAFIRGATNYAQTSVDMFNGQMVVGRYGGYGISVVNFIHDRPISYWDASNIGYFDGNISQRNDGAGVLNSAGYGIGNVQINDVAIAALKDSPIDVTTGLPYPTMALATNDGVTIIKSSQDTDSLKYDVVGIKATNGSYNEARKVKIDAHNNRLYAVTEGGSLGLLYQWKLPWGKDLSSGTMAGYSGVAWLHYTPHGIQGTSGVYTDYWPKYTNTDIAVRKNGEIWSVSGDGISVIKPDFNADYTMDKTPMVAGIGTHHNSGWMYGRGTGGCKIGSLCETTAGILGDKGTNLVPNGTFDSDINGWTDIATSYTTETHTSGKLQLVASGGTARVEEEVTVVSGKYYTYEYQCVSNGGGSNFSHLSTASNTGGTIYATNIGLSNTGYHQHTFLASATSLFIQLGATNGTTAQFDNVRVYETSECMDNGYMNTVPDGQPGHDNGDNTVDGWSAIASAELSIDNYALKIKHTQSGSWSGGGAQYALGSRFVPGVQYCVRWRVKTGGTSGNFSQGIGARIQKSNAGHSNSTLVTLVSETSDPGSSFVNKVAYFTAERANYGIHFFTYYGVANYEMHIDNISIKPVANSYAITSNFQGKPMGLEPRGRIVKEAVATGAELCCYKDFDDYNALVQRYNTELDYGTGDFYYMVWINTTMNGSGNLEGLISRQTDGQSSGNRIQMQADNGRNVYLYCGGYNGDTTANLSKGGWTHIAFIRRGEMGYVYEDGRLRKYFDETTNYTNANANLRIGGLSLGSSIEENTYKADQTKFALFKTGGYAPTEKELRVIVKEERKLFGENVKCTLYGASDYQIPAVACDTSTDTIHVGTASGRSEFDGLARINNTTDPVTVVVSASNGLVAQE